VTGSAHDQEIATAQRSGGFDPMTELAKKALNQTLGFAAFLGLLLAVAGGPDFWLGLRYWVIFTLCSLAVTLYFLGHDPGLVERRLSAPTEKDESQQMIRGLLIMAMILLFVVSGIDHRLGWSHLRAPVTAIAEVVVVLGFAVVFLTFRANSHAGAVVDVTPDQQVVSTGPYAFVRHPMYLGGALVLLATPFALGSTWAVPWAVAAVACLVWRLVEEERYLSQHLPGYDDYRRHTPYRLIPFVW
jgi:protein-S-isoprenylcysteine O-methyltransferase Ste14